MESPSKPYSRPRVRRKKRVLDGCQDCHVHLNDDNWTPSMQGKTGNRPRYICKTCWTARQRRYSENESSEERNARKRKRVKERQAAWSDERRERERRRQYNNKLLKTYGITIETYEDILASQGGKCCMCLSDRSNGRGVFHVDHCHATGVVRGILCASCNMMLGMANDDPEILTRAIEYLLFHSAKRVGPVII